MGSTGRSGGLPSLEFPQRPGRRASLPGHPPSPKPPQASKSASLDWADIVRPVHSIESDKGSSGNSYLPNCVSVDADELPGEGEVLWLGLNRLGQDLQLAITWYEEASGSDTIG